jgi:hypothetical protein
MFLLLIRRPGAPGTHWIGGWVDLRAVLDVFEKRQFLTLPGLELRLLKTIKKRTIDANEESFVLFRSAEFLYIANVMFGINENYLSFFLISLK